jgi:hypothetical protein
MTINWLRGLGRFGWLLIFPLAAFIVFLLYEETKEFSATQCEIKRIDRKLIMWRHSGDSGRWLVIPPFENFKATKNTFKPDWALRENLQKGYEIPVGHYYLINLQSEGLALFSEVVPADIIEIILSDYVTKHPITVRTPDASEPDPMIFTVHKQINTFKLAGLIVGSILISVLFVQIFIRLPFLKFKAFNILKKNWIRSLVCISAFLAMANLLILLYSSSQTKTYPLALLFKNHPVFMGIAGLSLLLLVSGSILSSQQRKQIVEYFKEKIRSILAILGGLLAIGLIFALIALAVWLLWLFIRFIRLMWATPAPTPW